MSGQGYIGHASDDGENKIYSETNKSIREFAEKPARETGPVVQYLGQLDNEIDRLDHALSQLIDKVNPILNPHVSGEGGDDVTEKVQSLLSHEIESKCERVHRITDILHDVTRRIEL